MAYYNLEPFGEERGDLRSGIVASTIANANRDTRKQRKPFKPEDFMPKFETAEPKTAPQILSIVEELNAAFGGKDIREK